jgi:hypothetical protein
VQSALDDIGATNANAVSLVPRIVTQSRTSNDIIADPAKTESMTNPAAAIADAHARRFDVLLKPLLTAFDRTNQQSLAPSDVAAFFASYRDQIVEYARLAQATGKHCSSAHRPTTTRSMEGRAMTPSTPVPATTSCGAAREGISSRAAAAKI